MPRRRCFYQCESKTTTFGLPMNSEVRDQWLKFIFNTIPDQYNQNTVLCSDHFTPDCFENYAQFTAGFAIRLVLKDGAVPTLTDRAGVSGSQPSTSHQDSPGHLSSRRFIDRECQTIQLPNVSEPTQTPRPKMVSVATQLSMGTLMAHVRSKGTQATMPCAHVDTETSPSSPHFSSTPIQPATSRPRKRPHLELEEEEEEEEEDKEASSVILAEPDDSTYIPGESNLTEESVASFQQKSTSGEAKYIVFESCLTELFNSCPACKRNCDVQRQRMGTFVGFQQLCKSCSYSRKWQSQPIIGSTPVGNLQMSAATYFTGASFLQLEKICKAMQLQIFRYDTFRRHARSFIEPAIIHKWKTDQENLFKVLRQEGKVAVGGDMLADSPGHSAKYGTYTVMHLEKNAIVDLQLVQSNEVGGSYHMEKEGLKRCLDVVESNSLAVEYIVTDRHPQIQKFLRERNITQFYDVWHFEKGLSKKLDKLAQKKDFEVLKRWLRSIKNHIYWSATSSTSGPEKVAKWLSLLNHIQDVHVHEDPIFPKCLHPERESTDPSKWFQKGSVQLHKVEKILNNKRVLRDVEKLSHHHQTSSLEAFHSLILRFAPKNVAFPFIGMLCRLYLAAMHYNENAHRDQATTSTGQAVFKVVFPKFKKGEGVARPVKTDPTFIYVEDLMRLVFDVFVDPAPYVARLKDITIPSDLASQYDRPSKEEVVARHVSRFSQGVVESQHTDQPDQETPDVSGVQHKME